MKKIILSVALFSATLSFAQQKEVKKAFIALEGNDFALANTNIQAADALLGDKTYLLEPAILEQYYLTKGIGLLKAGKTQEGVALLGKIADLGKTKIFKGKNADKKKVYFVGKAAADASGISGLKEISFTPAHQDKIRTFVNPILQSLSKKTIDAYNGKNFAFAGDGFQQVYYLLKVAGQDDPQYLYNSAISYAYAKNNSKSIEVFKSLIDKGYTGVQTTYTAKDKTTGKEIPVDKATWNLLKKNPQYTDFKTQTSPSIEEGLFDTVVALLIEEKRYDEALSVVEKGLIKIPKSSKLLNQQGIIYQKLGKTDEFINNLKIQLASNPNDAVSWYNLGVLYGKSDKGVEAEKAYKKAIEIDSTLKNAYLNLAYQIIGDDDKVIKEYNSLINKSSGRAKAEQILKDRRVRFEKALPYAEKLYELDQTKDNAALLKNIYRAVKNKEKYQEFQQIEEKLSK